MKTIGDLRELITDEGGPLVIGAIKISYQGKGDDIDVYLEDDLVMWFPSSNEDSGRLDDAGNYSVDSRIHEGFEVLQAERKATRKLEEAEKKLAEAAHAIGKVEAYEKLIIGRELTIGK